MFVRFLAAVLPALWLIGASCAAASGERTVTVFAAASLHDAFADIGNAFQRKSGVRARFDFDGSQILEIQIAQGAPADVFASADKRWMNRALAAHLVTRPQRLASNRLAIVAGLGSPVRTLADIARPDIKLDLCAPAVPCGRYARQAFDKMRALPRLGSRFVTAVLRNVVSEEPNVEAVVAKVRLGEADAGVVYATDVSGAGSNAVRTIPIPVQAQVTAAYSIAVVSNARQAALARAFVAFVLSEEGRRTLKKYGFQPPR